MQRFCRNIFSQNAEFTTNLLYNKMNLLKIFIIQNENHALNFLHLDKNEADYIYISLDKYSGLNTTSYLGNEYEKLICLENKSSFLFQSANFIQKLLLIKTLTKEVKSILNRYEKKFKNVEVFIGNDGALQKAIIVVSKNIFQKSHVTMWIDTIMGDRPVTVKTIILRYLDPILSMGKISQYFPSIFGISSLVNTIFVSHTSNKSVLIRRGVNADKIFIQESPRISMLKTRYKKEKKNEQSKPKILFVASAWEWHKRNDVEAWQTNVLIELIAMAKHHKDFTYDISIRLHPRQSQHVTSLLDPQYINTDNSFESALLNAAVIVSFRSSALYDAALIGKETFVYEVGAPETPKNTFIDSLKRLNHLTDILNI